MGMSNNRPVLGIIFGFLGIIYAKKAMNGSKKGMATAAFVIGIITWCLSVLNALLAIILPFVKL